MSLRNYCNIPDEKKTSAARLLIATRKLSGQSVNVKIKIKNHYAIIAIDQPRSDAFS